jgi:hypothetical protein
MIDFQSCLSGLTKFLFFSSVCGVRKFSTFDGTSHHQQITLRQFDEDSTVLVQNRKLDYTQGSIPEQCSLY